MLASMIPKMLPIIQRRKETHDIFTLNVDASSRAEEGLSFLPGQFNMMYVFGAGEIPVSISGDADDPNCLVHTIRAVGVVSRRLQQLKRGDLVGIRGPFGISWPLEKLRSKDIMIIAGGIGLAPLRPFIYHLLRHRGWYRTVRLYYGARSPLDIIYASQLRKWHKKLDMNVSVIVDHATAEWEGNVGTVTSLLAGLNQDPKNTIAVICGPEVMMRFTLRELNNMGIADRQIYLSMERNMQCAIGLCGHCQYGPTFICKDGPVFRYDKIKPFFGIREL